MVDVRSVKEQLDRLDKDVLRYEKGVLGEETLSQTIWVVVDALNHVRLAQSNNPQGQHELAELMVPSLRGVLKCQKKFSGLSVRSLFQFAFVVLSREFREGGDPSVLKDCLIRIAEWNDVELGETLVRLIQEDVDIASLLVGQAVEVSKTLSQPSAHVSALAKLAVATSLGLIPGGKPVFVEGLPWISYANTISSKAFDKRVQEIPGSDRNGLFVKFESLFEFMNKMMDVAVRRECVELFESLRRRSRALHFNEPFLVHAPLLCRVCFLLPGRLPDDIIEDIRELVTTPQTMTSFRETIWNVSPQKRVETLINIMLFTPSDIAGQKEFDGLLCDILADAECRKALQQIEGSSMPVSFVLDFLVRNRTIEGFHDVLAILCRWSHPSCGFSPTAINLSSLLQVIRECDPSAAASLIDLGLYDFALRRVQPSTLTWSLYRPVSSAGDDFRKIFEAWLDDENDGKHLRDLLEEMSSATMTVKDFLIAGQIRLNSSSAWCRSVLEDGGATFLGQIWGKLLVKDVDFRGSIHDVCVQSKLDLKNLIGWIPIIDCEGKLVDYPGVVEALDCLSVTMEPSSFYESLQQGMGESLSTEQAYRTPISLFVRLAFIERITLANDFGDLRRYVAFGLGFLPTYTSPPGEMVDDDDDDNRGEANNDIEEAVLYEVVDRVDAIIVLCAASMRYTKSGQGNQFLPLDLIRAVYSSFRYM